MIIHKLLKLADGRGYAYVEVEDGEVVHAHLINPETLPIELAEARLQSMWELILHTQEGEVPNV